MIPKSAGFVPVKVQVVLKVIQRLMKPPNGELMFVTRLTPFLLLIVVIWLMDCICIPVVAQEKQKKALTSSLEAVDWVEQIRGIDLWLQSLAKRKDGQVGYPVAAGSSSSASHLYSGYPGIALFYWYAHEVTEEPLYRKRFDEIARRIASDLQHTKATDNPALFTGYSGLGWTLLKTDPHSNRDSIVRCIELLKSSAKKSGESEAVTWNEVTDIIGGSAGIGFFLIEAHQTLEAEGALPLAIAAGDGLIGAAIDVDLGSGKSGLKWLMQPSYAREMPNYSHGTAGVCDFLLALDEACTQTQKADSDFVYDGRFQEVALKGARYLTSVDRKFLPEGLLPHHFPDGGQLNYLGWCHGPPGTCQLIQRLDRVVMGLEWQKYETEAIGQLLMSKLAVNRTDGFWDNVGLCCGSAGVASFLLDCGIRRNDPKCAEEAILIAEDILRRARVTNVDGNRMISWPSAEHRVRPELIESQTGLMQGAAGVGLFFLQLESYRRNPDQVPFSIFGDIFP